MWYGFAARASRRPLTLPVLLLAGVLGGTVLAGCDKGVDVQEPEGLSCSVPSAPLAIAYGARANSPKPSLPQPLESVMKRAAMDRKAITVFRVDGEPSRVFEAVFSSEAKNDRALANDFNQFVGAVQQSLSEVRSKTAEADPLAALTLAGRAAGSGGTVVLFDSGLQTTAPLDFRTGELLDAEPTDVVEFLKAAKLMPDLSGRTVILAGVGNTAPPQAPLDTRRHNNVIDIWHAIADAAGAACVAVIDKPGAQTSVQSKGEALQPVTVVPTPAEESWVSCGQTILRNNGRVGFKPNQAVFVDPAAARQALGELATMMMAGNQRAELVGTTATDGPEQGRLTLSKARAEKVKQELVSLGVPADRITTQGVGTHWPTHVNDIGPHGELLPGPAAQNRSVVVNLTCQK